MDEQLYADVGDVLQGCLDVMKAYKTAGESLPAHWVLCYLLFSLRIFERGIHSCEQICHVARFGFLVSPSSDRGLQSMLVDFCVALLSNPIFRKRRYG